MKVFVSIIFILLLGCKFSDIKGKISFRNNSKFGIDSLVIDANATRLVMRNVKPNETCEIPVSKEMVKGGHHLEMTSTFYIDGDSFKGQYYYNDLSGFYGDYVLKLGDDLKTNWEQRN